MVSGIRPLNLSLDNYFIDRIHTPKDEKGEYDFEALKQLAENKSLDLWQPDLLRIGGVEKWI